MGHSICSVDGFDGAHMDLIIHLYTSVAGGYIDKRPILNDDDYNYNIYCINIRECIAIYICRDDIGCAVFPIHWNRSEIPNYAENRGLNIERAYPVNISRWEITELRNSRFSFSVSSSSPAVTQERRGLLERFMYRATRKFQSCVLLQNWQSILHQSFVFHGDRASLMI